MIQKKNKFDLFLHKISLKKEDFFNLGFYFIVSRLLLAVIVFSVLAFVPNKYNDFLINFDAEHYLNIAFYGYIELREYAFFPLFPLIINFFDFLNIPIVGTLLFNNIITFITGIIIFKISTKIYNKEIKVGLGCAKLWYFSPIGIFTSVLYSEALFCFLTVLVIYLYKKKTMPILMGVLMGLATATRSTGSILFFVIFSFLAIDLFLGKKEEWKLKITNILKIYIPATIISCLYPIYLQITLGNWKYFVDVQYELWSKAKGNFLATFLKDIYYLINQNYPTSNRYYPQVNIEGPIQTILMLCAIGVIIYIFTNRINPSKTKNTINIFYKEWYIYLLVTVIICFSTYRIVASPSTSYFRYLFAMIPIYFLLDKEKHHNYFLALFIPMNFIITFFYTLEYLVF